LSQTTRNSVILVNRAKDNCLTQGSAKTTTGATGNVQTEQGSVRPFSASPCPPESERNALESAVHRLDSGNRPEG